MAIYSGKSIAKTDSQALDDRAWLSVNLQTADEGYKYAPVHTLVPSPGSGSRLYVIPQPHINTFDGQTVNTPPVLYDKWITVKDAKIVPYDFDLGVVAPDTQTTVGIWNSHAQESTVTGITLAPTNALEISGLEVGSVFGFYEEIATTFTVKFGAPPFFDITVTIEFDNSPDLVLSVSGQVGVLLPYRPQSVQTETLEFLTDIITTRNGKEQRIGYRKIPRQSFAVNYDFAFDNKSMALRNILEARAGYPILYPTWTEQRNAEAITATDTVITCSTDYADFRDSGFAFVYQDADNFEAVQVATVGAGVLNLSLGVVGSYSSPVVMPLNRAFGNVQTQGNETANGSIQYKLNMRIAENAAVEAPTFAQEYNGTPVITDGGWFSGERQRRGINAGAWGVDNKSGAFFNQIKWNIPKNSFEYGYSMQSLEEIWAFRQFLHYLNGMQKSVWVPTLDNDFTLTRSVASGDQTLYVKNDNYSVMWGDLNHTDHVAIYDGATWYFREITNSDVIDSDEEFITIDSSLGTAYNPADLKVMRMPLARLLSDTIKFEWVLAGQADASLTFVEVQQ